MDKKIAGLLGAAAALTTVTAAHAAVSTQPPLAPATSYQDLLGAVPNATAALKLDNARLAADQAGVQVAQYHHHHHFYHHHHHHFVPPIVHHFFFRHHHHHHHYHHHHYYR